MELVLKCKDFDAWVSFLGRLNKIGSGYIIKNDIILATVKGTKSGSNDKIPGRHIIKDPLFIDDEDSYIPDAVYGMYDGLDKWINVFKNIKETNKEARKEIRYIRRKEGIFIRFYGGIEFQIFGLVEKENIDNEDEFIKVMQCANGIKWFNNFVETPELLESEWLSLNQDTLISLRDGEPLTLTQTVSEKPMWARIAKSVFTMAGVSRIGSPIANQVEYSFIPPAPTAVEPIGMLELHAVYKSPADSKLIKVECIPEYMILIYKEED